MRALTRLALPALLVLAIAGSAAAATALATATYVKGEVTVERGQESKILTRGDPLFEGDTVVTAKKAKATLVFEDGTIQVVRQKKRYTVGKRAVAEKDRSLTEVGTAAAKYFFSADQKKSNLRAIAGTRGGEGPAELAALAPVGELLRPPAELVWTPVPGAARYQVKLHEDTGTDDPSAPGDEVAVTDTRLPLSRFSKTKLGPDTIYIWRVTAEQKDGKKLQGWSWFQFLPGEEAKELETARERLYTLAKEDPEDTTPHYLLANIYLGRDLTFAAIQEYRKLLARAPEDPEAKQGLVDLYKLLRFSDGAREQFEKTFPVTD